MKKIWVISAKLVEFEQELLYLSSKEEAEKTLEYLKKVGDNFDYDITEDVLYESFDEVKRFLDKIEDEHITKEVREVKK